MLLICNLRVNLLNLRTGITALREKSFCNCVSAINLQQNCFGGYRNTCGDSQFENTNLNRRKTSDSRYKYNTCRTFSSSSIRQYELPCSEERNENPDIKKHAVDIFTYAIKAVHPQQMIENVLQMNATTSTLAVTHKTYKVNRNVFVVGMGKAVLGMAKVVEEVLGEHVVTGIISIPKGLQQEFGYTSNGDMMLKPNTKIQIYEGENNNEVDVASYNAAKAIHSLVSKLTEKDLLIVLCSGGGSTLCPFPESPITLDELQTLTRLLARAGATVHDLNTLRKNVEVLKGGGLARLAEPAKVISLVLSSVSGDNIDLTASGPTCPSQPTPHHCFEILQRLNIQQQTPDSIKKFLEKQATQQIINHANHIQYPTAAKAELDANWNHIQNIVVGNNSIACEAAAVKALELGYHPLVLTKVLTGEARKVGALYAKLAKFIMVCYDRKASMEHNPELSVLEIELVSNGLSKEWMNNIADLVDNAHNMNKDVCIIAGGETIVYLRGNGVGGKNQEAVLSAAIQLKKQFRDNLYSITPTQMAFLSADTDGNDGLTKVAGAVINIDFLDQVETVGLNMEEYLQNNDSFNLFSQTSGGSSLIHTNLTSTNVMDMMILLVQRPKEKKFVYTSQ